jgi:hypothetical protein
MACPTCKSEGFKFSRLGQDRCTFCDGTEGGNPPSDIDVAELLHNDIMLFGTSFAMMKSDGKACRLLPSTVRIEDANS